MFYPLFINVLGKGTQKYRDNWALFADNFLILQTITNLINRKIDFLSTNYKRIKLTIYHDEKQSEDLRAPDPPGAFRRDGKCDGDE